VSELFILLLMVVGIPVFVAMLQNYMDDKRRSRKIDRTICPPHKWIHIIDDINNVDGSIIVCEWCGSRNPFNN
jgi:hypothetical protein